jgi:hypothetical protein
MSQENDISATFWNPAALAFLPKREIQGSADYLRQSNEGTIFGRTEALSLSRLRISTLGIIRALPTAQGGFTLGFAFQNPIVFSDVERFIADYYSLDGDTNYYTDSDYRAYGDLNFWTGSFGMQVARGFGIGASASFISGGDREAHNFHRTANGAVVNPFNSYYDRTVERHYAGYDFRFGALFRPSDLLSVGIRIVMPKSIWFSEDLLENYPSTSESDYTASYKGKLLGSFEGGIGASSSLPVGTFSAEVHARAPYTLAYPDLRIPGESPAFTAKIGGSAGVEIPIRSLLLRGGYGIDEEDPFLLARTYDKTPIDWSMGDLALNPYRQRLTAGICYIAETYCLDFSYGYLFWGSTQRKTLTSDSNLHRLLVSVSVRY